METNQVTAPGLREKLPENSAHLAAVPELAAAWNHELTERRAQAAKVESLLEYKARKLEANKEQHSFTRRAVEKAVTRDAATALGLTEATVRRLLGTAEFLTEKLPKTWETYRTGAIDRESATKAAQAVEDIAHRQDLLPVIDAEIAERAPNENAGAVQKWVPQRVAELDTVSFQERYDRAQAKRYVTFRHLGNGMSRIEALIPTLIAAQVEQQIHTVARNAPRNAPRALPTAGAGSDSEGAAPQEPAPEERTLSQRIADAFIERINVGASPAGPVSGDAATTGSGPTGGVTGSTNLKIGILVPVQTLTGESDYPAISWDRSWSLPAGTARQIALDPDTDHDWYIAGTAPSGATASPSATHESEAATDAGRGSEPAADAAPEILTVVHPRKGPGSQPLEDWIAGTDPNSGNLLTRTYQSRTSRDRQRDAVLMRDGQCTKEGCTNPGWQAEIDHTQSFETGGHTTGENLKVLCRDCHSIKSHQLEQESENLGGAGNTDSARSHRGYSQQSGTEHSGPVPTATTRRETRTASEAPARASPTEDDLPEWLIETRPPPDWAVSDAA